MSQAPQAVRAVVFAYHNVGARCLRVLLAHGVDVALVVTHADNPAENIWFESVAEVARDYDLPVATPDDANTRGFAAQLRALQPDFFFSFYYRQMLEPALLAIPTRGGYNMHGSLLPRYRGRVPVNWALINGERETGATLHRMVERPDAGEIVAQQAVPILPDDTAGEVFAKVTLAAELALDRVLPALLGGTATHLQPDLSVGSYFGGRKPDDGRIDWKQPAAVVHNLIRAVAPPYPGAFFFIGERRIVVTRSLTSRASRGPSGRPELHTDGDHLLARCADGGVLRILSLEVDGEPLAPAALPARLGQNPIPLV
ncbi:MAG: Bifunctional polymyxin resistance protein ArnA [Candidatus Accumulibacter regalis]|uniref:Bifunctional polymyxin resistance protein ArnA n=1 Tax=Accumulibacter regalis TaxID=522306 RepID=A0A011R464_ACCRE|nr:formyltransferase [Accumulibacter sp.]EXI85929.1 MAG: Bifunctional polymyxin resistance protein ArnA [Candidatus Accumulibacter regalis]HRE72163.1 formyltransferase [Accumulibacter sp.]